ncbi:MAG: hypothetical protein G01um10148_233 [Parcubacteria group bacterium Gr01-1014_8]|nr:MAG: hypothetical protein G01um10148_233 [Parcubacteria group bacterium Gr01-1014_8]
MSMEGGPKPRKGILSGLQRWLEQRKERITLEEVRDHLSFNLWKTADAVCTEILENRLAQGRTAPKYTKLNLDRSNYSEWQSYFDMRSRTSNFCIRLFSMREADVKQENELTDQERQWARTGPSDDDRRKTYFANTGHHIPYFRLVRGGSRRRVEQSEGDSSPITVKS